MESFDVEVLEMFAERWAAGAMRGAGRVRDARKRALVADRNLERMEDWSPTEEEVGALFDEFWVESHLFVLAAQHFYSWAERLAAASNDVTAPAVVESLKDLRNVLEHLDEAAIDDSYARPNPDGSRRQSIRNLPGQRLLIGSDLDAGKVFGTVDIDQIERACATLMHEIVEARMAPHIDSYIQQLIDERRGK